MKRLGKRISSLAVFLAAAFSFALTAFAADSSVIYEGHNIFGFASGSEYTDTDLFDGFKGVMPGDILTEDITVKNTASCCDFIKVYMHAEVHGEENPLSPEVAALENVASMQDFLSQLTMTVWNGETKIYEASPDELDGLENNVLLGSFKHNEGTTLTVQLEVPAELSNEYAQRVGEVDWVFVIEEYDDETPDVPKTGDHTMIWPYILMMSLSFCGIVVLFITKYRKRNVK